MRGQKEEIAPLGWSRGCMRGNCLFLKGDEHIVQV